VNESIKRLEEKVAYLERHVTEQDKAMLELTEQLESLRLAVKALRERAAGNGPTLSDAGRDAASERPPHY
jgi:SlyX protein